MSHPYSYVKAAVWHFPWTAADHAWRPHHQTSGTFSKTTTVVVEARRTERTVVANKKIVYSNQIGCAKTAWACMAVVEPERKLSVLGLGGVSPEMILKSFSPRLLSPFLYVYTEGQSGLSKNKGVRF